MTIPSARGCDGVERLHQSARARPHLGVTSSLARIAAALDVRLGHIVDGTPEGEAQKVLFLRGQEHVLLTSADELRFHDEESVHSSRRQSPHDQLYSLPADVEIVYVAEGALELQVRDTVHRLETGESITYSPRDPHTWRNPSQAEPAVVLWLAVPNPYARL